MAAITLQSLLKTMLDKGASDLHVTAGSAPRLRIDGELVRLQTDALQCRTQADVLLGHERCTEAALKKTSKSTSRSAFATWRASAPTCTCSSRASLAHSAWCRTTLFRSKTSACPPWLPSWPARPRGLILVTGVERLGQVDNLGLDDRPDQSACGAATSLPSKIRSNTSTNIAVAW